MIEVDIQDYRKIDDLSENNYQKVELYDTNKQYVKIYRILNQELTLAIIPYLSNWNIEGCFHYNQLILIFPFIEAENFTDFFISKTNFIERVTLLQALLLSVIQEKLEPNLQSLLCDKSNLTYSQQWNLYTSINFEKLLRTKKDSVLEWCELCVSTLDKSEEVTNKKFPISLDYQAFHTTVLTSLSLLDILNNLERVKTCFNGIQPKVPSYKKHLKRGLFLIILMMLLSTLFLVYYEYEKQRQAYFEEITRIGDVEVVEYE